MLYIHIGLRKAGSSTIQHFFKKNQVALGPLGLVYPKSGLVGAAHHALYEDLKKNPVGVRPEGWAALAEEIKGDPRATLVSSEMFEVLKIEHIRKIPLYFPADQKFKIIVVLRNPLDLIPSIYSQATKFGSNVLDFDTFFTTLAQKGRLVNLPMVRTWAQVFGWESIEVRLLESAYLEKGDLVSETLKLTLPEASPEALDSLDKTSARNLSPGWKMVEMIRDYVMKELPHSKRREGNQADRRSKRNEVRATLRRSLKREVLVEIARDLETLADKGLYLSGPQARLALGRFQKDIERINARLVTAKIPEPSWLDGSTFRERPFLPDVSHISEEEREKFAALMKRYLDNGRMSPDDADGELDTENEEDGEE